MLFRHSNFAENTPIFLILLALIEMQGHVSELILGILGLTFLIARISHGYAFSKLHEPNSNHFFYRKNGMIATIGCIAFCVLLALYSTARSYDMF